jgi:6-phosphogluconolactonase
MTDVTMTADQQSKSKDDKMMERDWLDEHIFDDAEVMLDKLADFVAQQLGQALIQQSTAAMVVSGGGTPKPLYTRLQRMDVDWSKVTITLSDERWVPPTDPQSNQKMIQETLMMGLAGRAALVPLLTSHDDPTRAEAVVAQRLNTLAKPYNLTILGMGADGHFASLFPDCPEIKLGFETTQPCIGVHPKKTETPRMSLTLHELLNSQRIILLFTGQEKWDVYQQALSDLEGDVLSLPIRALLAHQRVPVQIFWAP